MRRSNPRVPFVAMRQKMLNQKLKFKYNRMRALFSAYVLHGEFVAATTAVRLCLPGISASAVRCVAGAYVCGERQTQATHMRWISSSQTEINRHKVVALIQRAAADNATDSRLDRTPYLSQSAMMMPMCVPLLAHSPASVNY